MIQEQIEAARTRLIEALDYAHFARELSVEVVDNLIRQVVEKCCNKTCEKCAEGVELVSVLTDEGELFWHRPFIPDKPVNHLCEATEIRRHFAWLEGE